MTKERKKIIRTCELVAYALNELDSTKQQLIDRTKEALSGAFAPYSNFRVSSAALLDDGTIVIGSNQENAAYPSGLCAERVALFAVGAQHPGKKVKTLAVYAPDFAKPSEVPMPCGACRQVMNQTEQNQKEDIELLLLTGQDEVYIAQSTEDLLPFPFRL